MHYLWPILLFVVGGLIVLGGATLLFEARKKKEGMDIKDKKGNIVGSIFLLTVATVLILGGVSTWQSSKTTKDAIENKGQQVQKAVTDVTSQTNQAKTQEQPKQTPEQVQAKQKVKKQEAENAVKSFAQVQKNFDSVLTSYQPIITDISNGTIYGTGYNDLDKLSLQALDLFRNVQEIDVAKQYIYDKEIMLTAVLYLQGSIDYLKSYMDDKKVSKFTEAQDFLQKAIEANKLVTLGVEKQAIIDR